MQEQINNHSKDFFIQEGDWIELVHQTFVLYSEGFKSTEVIMKNYNQSPLLSLFIIQLANPSNKLYKKVIHFNEPIVLLHRLTNKYLAFNPNFANKSQLRLKTVVTEHCRFILKPLYRCQTIGNNSIRNKEQLILSPANSQYLSQNINLVIGRYEKNDIQKLPVYSKKNEQTALRIMRKNRSDKKEEDINNLSIYQLKHFQTRKWLQCNKSQQNTYTIKIINSKNHYGSFLMFQLQKDNSEEYKINAAEIVYIRFPINKKYLGFDIIGNLYFSQHKVQQAKFVLQIYSSNALDLNINSMIKIKHQLSHKYLSLQHQQFELKKFSPFNIYQFSILTTDELKNNIFINENYDGLLEQFKKLKAKSQSRRLILYLKEIIKFIYQNKNIYNQFLKQEIINPSINSQQQQIFYQIGFIDLLYQISISSYHHYKKVVQANQDKKLDKSVFLDKYDKKSNESMKQSKYYDNIQKRQSQNNQKEYNQDEYIYILCCMIMTGICKNNKNNLQSFTHKYIKQYINHIGKINGSIELFYYIFCNNSIGLFIFDEIQYNINDKKVNGFQFLCQHIRKLSLNMNQKAKMLKLLHGFILNQKQQKIQINQEILIKKLLEVKMQNIFIFLSNNQQFDINININKKMLQLTTMIENQYLYEEYLQVIYEQINLLISLCDRGSQKHLDLFRNHVSQPILKRYLKSRMNSKFKALFLKILIRVYLSQNIDTVNSSFIVVTNPKKKGYTEDRPFKRISDLSMLSNRLLEKSRQRQMQEIGANRIKFLTDIYSLNQIKQLIKQLIKNKIKQKDIGQQLIFSLFSIKSFLEYGICQALEGDQILKQLEKLIQQSLINQITIRQEQLIQEYLKLLNFQLQYKLKIYSKGLLIKYRERFDESSTRSQQGPSIVNTFNQFIRLNINPILDKEVILLLKNIIDHSINNNLHDLFSKTSLIYHKFLNLPTLFINLIKNNIIIESQDSNVLLCKINKLSNALNNQIIQFIYSQENSDLPQIRKRITYLVIELNQMLLDCNQDEKINVLAQKIIADFKIADIALELVVHKQYYLDNQNSQLIKQIFKFIELFLLQSQQNIRKYIHSISKMKAIFRFIDRGQIKLLYELTHMNHIILEMNYNLIQCWMMALTNNRQPKLYIPLGLIRLTKGQQIQISTKIHNVAALHHFLMNQPSNFSHLLKIGTQQQLSLKKPKYNQSIQQWILYIILVFRLLSIIIQNKKQQNDLLLVKIKEWISVRTLANILQQSFTLQFQCEQFTHFYYLIIKMIKKEILRIFQLLYMKDLQNCDIDYIVFLMQKTVSRMIPNKTQSISDDSLLAELLYNNHQGNDSQKLQQNSHLKEIIVGYLSLQSGKKTTITSKMLHQYHNNVYLFINSYILFIFKLYDKITEIYPKNQQKYNQNINTFIEMNLLINNLIQNLKEISQQKLIYSEYSMYYEAYNNSLMIINEIIEDKIKLNFIYKEQEEDQIISLIEGSQYLYDRQMGFVVAMYLRSRNKIEKYLYEIILILMYNRNVKSTIQHSNQLTFAQQPLKKCYQFIINNFKSPLNQINTPLLQNFITQSKLLLNFISQCQTNIDFPPTLQYQSILNILFNQNQIKLNIRLKYYLQLQTKLLQNYFKHLQNESKRYDIIEFNTSKQFNYCFEELKERINDIIQYQIILHEKKMVYQQGIIYFQTIKNNYTKESHFIHIQLVLLWILFKIKYNFANIERYQSIIIQILSLFKTYVKFIELFGKKYVTKELHNKIQLCLKIIFKCVTGNNIKMIMVLMQHQIWNQINILLSLDDSLQKHKQQFDFSTYDFIKKLTRIKLQNVAATYIQSILQIYNNSLAVYCNNNEIISIDQYSLIPIKSYFSHLKYILILIIKQFKHIPLGLSVQFYTKIHVQYIDYNLTNIYEQYRYIFGKFDNFGARKKLINAKFKGRDRQIAMNVALENGVQLMALKLHIQVLNSKYENLNKYIKYRINVNGNDKFKEFIDLLKCFFIDSFMLFFGWLINRKSNHKHNFVSQQITQFFTTKIGKIEIMFHDKIYSNDFMIYPQCKVNQNQKNQCLRGINFISNQLKRESILLQIQRFILKFKNEVIFYERFSNFGIMFFFDKYIFILKLISYIIVIINNVLLITNNIESIHYQQIDVDHPFEILTMINFLDSIIILLVYVIKQFPLKLKVYYYDMSQGIGYYGRNFNEKSQAKKNMIIILKMLTNGRFIYNLIYAIIVGMALFFNKLFVSLLLFDILIHIPSLKTILLSIWKPRYQIILIIITYIILQYFFSICIYFLFKNHVNPYCDDLGKCFGFILFTASKAVHGFVGYLFDQQPISQDTFRISFFQSFQDLYVILIYQIMAALILGIVIQSFTMARTQKLKQLQRLNSACIICNIDCSRFNIESKLGFEGHQSINHNIFNYISFKYNILIKDPQLLSDFELFIIKDKTSNWIPDRKAIQLQDDNTLNQNVVKQ